MQNCKHGEKKGCIVCKHNKNALTRFLKCVDSTFFKGGSLNAIYTAFVLTVKILYKIIEKGEICKDGKCDISSLKMFLCLPRYKKKRLSCNLMAYTKMVR